jgi:prefoldin subunit 5
LDQTEADELAARLARLKPLIESLEAECAASAEAQANFDKLKAEMGEISRRLKLIQRP